MGKLSHFAVNSCTDIQAPNVPSEWIPFNEYSAAQELRNAEMSGPVKTYKLPREEIEKLIAAGGKR